MGADSEATQSQPIKLSAVSLFPFYHAVHGRLCKAAWQVRLSISLHIKSFNSLGVFSSIENFLGKLDPILRHSEPHATHGHPIMI